jgi:hypothetical protein
MESVRRQTSECRSEHGRNEELAPCDVFVCKPYHISIHAYKVGREQRRLESEYTYEHKTEIKESIVQERQNYVEKNIHLLRYSNPSSQCK